MTRSTAKVQQTATQGRSLPLPAIPEQGWHGLTLLVLGLLIAGGLYARGLLADYAQFKGLALVGPVVFLLLAWRVPRLSWRDFRTWAMVGLAAAHTLPLLWPAHRSNALLGVLLFAVAMGVYLLGVRLAAWPASRVWVSTAVALLAGATSLYGLLVLAGYVSFPQAYSGLRLGSTLQYPNVLAALAGAGLLAGLTAADENGLIGWRQPLLFLNGFALLLTDSRAGIAVTAVALLGFAAVSIRRHARAVLVAGIHLAAALWAFMQFRELVKAADQLPNPEILSAALPALAAATALGLVIEWLFRRLPLWVGWLVTAVAGAGGALAVWKVAGSLLPRFAALGADRSTVERWANLVDAGKTLLQHPLGLGYMGWNSVYPSTQQFRYQINIAHSYPAEVAVAAGVIGLISLAAIWGGLAWSYWRAVRAGGHTLPLHALFWALGLLGLHSLVDADFHFVAVFLLVVLGWGYLHGADAQPAARPAYRLSQTGRGILALVAVGVGIGSWFLGVGAQEAKVAARLLEQKEYGAAIQVARRARRHNPFHPEPYRVEAVARFDAAAAGGSAELLEPVDGLWQQAIARERFSSVLQGSYGAFLASQGDLARAEEYLTAAIRLAPWDVTAWEALVGFHVQAGYAYLEAGREDEALQHRQKAQQVLLLLEGQKQTEPAHTPKENRMDTNTPALQKLRQALAQLGK